uniref:SURF1-like protein n=1 Tax=Rhizobium leguminosarum TaxID=384 RepID=A0A179BWP5_RHILE|nr:hypothetical protein A4U53_01380 [Rhizobium leguminosarum]
MSEAHSEKSERRRYQVKRAIFAACLILLAAALAALGTWQVERLAWKRDLIARVDQRVHAAPMPAPARADWDKVNATDDEYRRVTAVGTLANDKETLVYASTALGPGYWVMAPLTLADGTSILVNRGFVPTDRRDPASRREGELSGPIEITGLLRMTEPTGSLLQSNDAAADRWYSRDVAAIAEKRGVNTVAPYFIDADATANPGGLPVGGLTVVAFPNNHLVYAITWYGLTAMVLALLVFIFCNERASP